MTEQPLWRRAIKDAMGSPGMSLAIVFLSFGAYLRSAGLDIFQSIAMNVFMYAVPGQLVALNGLVTKLSITSIVLLVVIINIRLMPMSFSISHHLKSGEAETKPPLLLYYFSAYFVAVTGWMNFFSNYRYIPAKDTFSYFLYTSIFLWSFAMLGFLLGYYLVDFIPIELFIALLLVNPLYFLLVVAGHGRDDLYLAISVIGGCLLYMPFAAINGSLALLFAGLTGGCLAFALRSYNKLKEEKE
ncbi:MAG: AzlC family ABC transporter permease [Candidatus Portiera sp.]|nr:AzlC family ABC transporter permease [Portiera sp.]